jgi:hypothetical protein
MPYEDLYAYTGHMGRLQWAIFFMAFVVIAYSMEFINMIFVGGTMDHWCRIEELSELAPDKQKYIGIPPRTESADHDDVIVRYRSCDRYDINWTDFSIEELTVWNWTTRTTLLNNVTTVPCTAWNFDKSTFLSTIVSRVS